MSDVRIDQGRFRKKGALEWEPSMVLQKLSMDLLILMTLNNLNSNNRVLYCLIHFCLQISRSKNVVLQCGDAVDQILSGVRNYATQIQYRFKGYSMV